MKRKEEELLLKILDDLAGTVNRLNESVRGLIDIARLLDERITRLEEK